MTELEKCKNDIQYFIENYCTVDGEIIRLKDYQIKLIKKLNHERNNTGKRCNN